VTARLLLCLNTGSSSLKYTLFRMQPDEPERLLDGAIEGAGREKSHREALEAVFARIAQARLPHPDAVGHRLVHGGPSHFLPEQLTPDLMAVLRSCVPFAPLHLPFALEAIDAALARLPDVPQVACFDTAFHRDAPAVAKRLPLPPDRVDQGLHRYGFHGLSCESVVARVGAKNLGRAVIAHLGSGASMTAVREGRSLDNTMGFSPTGGLMMSTRCGDIDPGVLIYLARQGLSADGLERVLNQQSGLLGVSGSTPDMKVLLQRRREDAQAALAVEMFCYQARKAVAGLAAALGGLDTLVFTGGMGEHSAEIRSEVCAGLSFLGIRLDPASNQRHAQRISAPASAVAVLVVPADEAVAIARGVERALSP
jgi:acetate kinase